LPEGDTVHKVARVLASDLLGQVLRGCQARRLDASCLIGARVASVVSEGKHLSIVCDNGLTLRSHLGLYGSWHRYAAGESWQRPAWQASLVLVTDARVLVCFNAKEVEIQASQGWRRRDAQGRLGPDLARGRALAAILSARMDALVGPETLLVDLLLDQRVAAGIGNVYKCEVLFLAGLAPLAQRGDLPADTLVGLYDLASDLLRANLGSGRRVTRRESDGRAGLWVYGRAGQPCLRCGGSVRRDRLGVNPRPTYWCSGCQTGP
jgi:endonuclease VIII